MPYGYRRVRSPPCLILALVLSSACASTPRRDTGGTGGSVAMTLVNRTSDSVCYLYLSPPGEDSWGNDWLGSGTLGAGEQQTLSLPHGQWDLRTENCQHEPTGLLRGARITRATTLVLQ